MHSISIVINLVQDVNSKRIIEVTLKIHYSLISEYNIYHFRIRGRECDHLNAVRRGADRGHFAIKTERSQHGTVRLPLHRREVHPSLRNGTGRTRNRQSPSTVSLIIFRRVTWPPTTMKKCVAISKSLDPSTRPCPSRASIPLPKCRKNSRSIRVASSPPRASSSPNVGVSTSKVYRSLYSTLFSCHRSTVAAHSIGMRVSFGKDICIQT